MLDDALKSQLKDVLQKLVTPVTLQASLDAGSASDELRHFLTEVSSLSDDLTFRDDGQDSRRPSFAIAPRGQDARITFAAIPLGHELTSFVLSVLQVGGVAPKLSEGLRAQIEGLTGTYAFTSYVSLSCQNCPEVVQALNAMSVLNANIRHTVVDGALFQDEVTRKSIKTVPQVELNGVAFASGRMDAADILRKLDVNADAYVAQSYRDVAPYDVLIVGAGPAGASAAVYAARKGLRTGIVAERFGGQVMETAGIENYISVLETDGPTLSAQLEAHVRAYDIDIISGQQAQKLLPATQPGGYHRVFLSGDVALQSRTVILAMGAHWRHLGVPGETEYRTKGVAFCPHCDGPFYKGKRVAVIGGGNSGVEAAIDLAGIVDHVTLLQRSASLKADAVLQDKLRSMPNIDVKLEALTQSIGGDGQSINHLIYRSATGAEETLAVEGVFVQIGLLPNAGWLSDVLALSPNGEIVVDHGGNTQIPGILAAGDVTTTPYKQIVIAVGDGAKAALSAFDYLIRTPVPNTAREVASAAA